MHYYSEAYDWKVLSLLKLQFIKLKKCSQSFLDTIPKYCPYLTELEIKEFDNLDFLFKLTFLKSLSLPDESKSLNLVKEIIKKLKYIQSINFMVNYAKTYIFKIEDCKVSLWHFRTQLFKEQKEVFLNSIYEEPCDIKQLIELKGSAICEFRLN